MKIVINTRVGGFSVSDAAVRALRARGNPYALAETLFGETYPQGGSVNDYKDFNFLYPIPRNDGDLVAVVESLGTRAFGDQAALKVVEVPDDVAWEIVEAESGREEIHEKHRVWR